MRRRAFVIAMVVLLLTLLLAGPAQAKTIRTPFTGTTEIIGEVWEGRYWVPGPHFEFWRGTTFILALDTTDDRVTGVMCADFNANYTLSPDPIGFVEGHLWGKVWIYPPMVLQDSQSFVCGEGDFMWEGSMTGDRAADGSEYTKINLKGRGVNEGLQVRMDQSLAPGAWYATVAGEVLDPGK